MNTDEIYMKRCLELARKGAGRTAPNPMVGCVVVHEGRIIGEGWHREYGGPHAEVEAVRQVADPSLLRASIMYVSLEPCSFHGKTPACTDLILKHEIPEVVVAVRDDHPKVSGAGIDIMRQAGIEVRTGVLEQEARRLNRPFFTFHNEGRPFVRLKWAVSADGFIAPESGRQWLSNPAAKRLTHRWRAEAGAILVGARTASLDDPKLTDRFWDGRQPLRVLLDPTGSADRNTALFTDGSPTLVLTAEQSGEEGAVAFHAMKSPQFEASHILTALADRGIRHLLVEGGAHTLGTFIDPGCWDQATIYRTPVLLGTGLRAPAPPGRLAASHRLGDNTVEVYERV